MPNAESRNAKEKSHTNRAKEKWDEKNYDVINVGKLLGQWAEFSRQYLRWVFASHRLRALHRYILRHTRWASVVLHAHNSNSSSNGQTVAFFARWTLSSVFEIKMNQINMQERCVIRSHMHTHIAAKNDSASIVCDNMRRWKYYFMSSYEYICRLGSGDRPHWHRRAL